RHAHAGQAAGHLVAVVVALTAGVQLGHDDLRRGHVLFLVDVHRDAAAVVEHRDRAVLVDGDDDFVGVPGERFVDRVVHDFEHHVVQAGAVVHVADVHARALSHRFQAAQHGDAAGVVIVVAVGGFGRGNLVFLRHALAGSGDARTRVWRAASGHTSYGCSQYSKRGRLPAAVNRSRTWVLQAGAGHVPRGTSWVRGPALLCRRGVRSR